MGSIEKIRPDDERFRGLLERYLLLRSRNGSPQTATGHLDEDSLTAFVEGNLTFRESDTAVGHLADCSFCRHKTSELARLNIALAEQDSPAIVSEVQEPAKVSEVLSGILSRLFGSGEAAVFAHEEKEDASDGESENDKKGSVDKED